MLFNNWFLKIDVKLLNFLIDKFIKDLLIINQNIYYILLFLDFLFYKIKSMR
jgi:hypothetical protein